MKSKKLKPFYSNKNISKKLVRGKELLIDEMFYSIQTEGPFTGTPAYFIRLFGCCMNCSFCDTPQNGPPEQLAIGDIMESVVKVNTANLVVITGGEPFLWDLGPLIKALVKEDFIVQIETCGLIPMKWMDLELVGKKVFIVVSPKSPSIDKQIAKHALAFKYIIDAVKGTFDNDGIPLKHYKPKNLSIVMVSPMFAKTIDHTDANVELAVSISKTYGYRMCVQWHKLIGIQ